MLGNGSASLDAFGLGKALGSTACIIIIVTSCMSEIFPSLHQFNFLYDITLLFSGLFTTVKHLNPEISDLFDFLNRFWFCFVSKFLN